MPFTVISASENLPRFVARRVSERGGKDFSGLIVVFPTLRLGQHFRKELVESSGACHPPFILTLNSLITRLIPPPAGRAVSGIERLLLLRSLLEERVFHHLGPGMEGVLSGFLQELADSGHLLSDKETYRELAAAFRENPFGSEEYAVYWTEFAEELKNLTLAYLNKLREMNLSEPGWELADPLRLDFPLPGETVFICGFYDATRIQTRFLKRLAHRAEFIYQAEKAAAFAPVIAFASSLGHDLTPFLPARVPAALAAIDSPEITPLPPETVSRFRLYSLPSITAEAKQAKYEALKANAGRKSVMVVIPRKPEYVNVFTSVFGPENGKPAPPLFPSSALARKCFEDPAVQLLQALLELAAARFSSYALSGFLLTPGGVMLVESDRERALEIAHRLRTFLAEVYLETYEQLIAALRDRFRERENGEELTAFIRRLYELLAPLARETGSRFPALARKTLNLFGRCCRLFPPRDLEIATRARVRASLRAITGAGEHLIMSGSVAEFFALAKEYIFAADVYTTPEPLKGVQLVHILEARAVPAEVIIICGMNEGDFPASLPRRLIEEPFIRDEFGLLTAEQMEALEELNFFSLICQAERVVLTRCPQALKEEAAESRFVTRLRLAGCSGSLPVPVGNPADNLLRRYRLGERGGKIKNLIVEMGSRQPEGFFPGRLPGEIDLSAFGCEIFFNCPARFFLDLHGIEAGPETMEEPDALFEGSTLHRVAAALWRRYRSGGEKWDRGRLEKALEELGREMIPDTAILAYLRLMMDCGGWKKFSRSLEGMLAAWRPVEWEKKMETTLRHGKHTFRLRGRADLVAQRPGGETLVVDFKRNNFPTVKEVRALVKPQLPFYSLCCRAQGIELTDLGYCSFLRKKDGYREMKEEGLGRRLRDRVKEQASAIISAGGYACLPDDRFCQYCPYSGVCRVEEIKI